MKNRAVWTCFIIASFIAGACLQGCASAKKSKPPTWIARGSGAFCDPEPRFVGVGEVQGIKDENLAKDRAGRRARAKVGELIREFEGRVAKQYFEETQDTAAKEQYEAEVMQSMKGTPPLPPAGIQVVETWKNPDSPVWYALAVFDLESFSIASTHLPESAEKQRKYFKENGLRIFKMIQPECK
jgi:hypothetical protein